MRVSPHCVKNVDLIFFLCLKIFFDWVNKEFYVQIHSKLAGSECLLFYLNNRVKKQKRREIWFEIRSACQSASLLQAKLGMYFYLQYYNVNEIVKVHGSPEISEVGKHQTHTVTR